jgi:hypothetical protein
MTCSKLTIINFSQTLEVLAWTRDNVCPKDDDISKIGIPGSLSEIYQIR